jgi:hypothetical protein
MLHTAPTRVMTAVVAAPTRHPAATSPRKCRPSSARLAAVAAPHPSTAAASGFDVACQHTAANSAMKDALHCHSICIWVPCKLTGLAAGCQGFQQECRDSRYICTAIASMGSDLEAWPLGKEYLSTETTSTKSSALLYTGRLGSRRSQFSNQDSFRAYGWHLLRRLVTGTPALLRLMPTIPAAYQGTCTTCMLPRSLQLSS